LLRAEVCFGSQLGSEPFAITLVVAFRANGVFFAGQYTDPKIGSAGSPAPQ
jgi:hypothetical protein